MICPQCNEPIRWNHIAFTAFPVWIKCKNCKTTLVGNALVKSQGIIVLILSLAFGCYIGAINMEITKKIILFVIGVSIISIPNIWLTIAKGKYDKELKYNKANSADAKSRAAD